MTLGREHLGRVPLRRLSGFRLFMIGETVSALGNSIGAFAMPLAVLAVAGSALTAGLVSAAAILGSILCSVAAGAWADTHSRRTVMLSTLVLRSATWTAMGLCLLQGGIELTVFMPLAFLGGVAAALFNSAQAGAVRRLVPSDLYPRAVAAIDGRDAAANIVGTPLGGVLVGIGASVPVLANAGSFVASLAAIAKIRTDMGTPTSSADRRFHENVRDGYRFVWERLVYRNIILLSTLMNLGCNAFTYALILILQRSHVPPWTIGLIPTGTAISALFGAFLVEPIIDRFSIPSIMIAADTLRISSLFGIAVWHDHVFACIGLAAAGFLFTPAANAAERAYMALTTPDNFQGRVQAFNQVVGSVFVPLAPITAGLLVSNLAPTTALSALAAVASVALAGVLASRSIRSLPLIHTLEEA